MSDVPINHLPQPSLPPPIALKASDKTHMTYGEADVHSIATKCTDQWERESAIPEDGGLEEAMRLGVHDSTRLTRGE
jgi:hypothetical protein